VYSLGVSTHKGRGETRGPDFYDFILPLQADHFSAQSAQFHFIRSHNPTARTCQFPGICSLNPIAHCLVTDPQFAPYCRNRLTIPDPSNSQFLELGRECLLRYLFNLLSSSLKVILTSPLENEISGEAQSSANE
jgi:hypothetical protein